MADSLKVTLVGGPTALLELNGFRLLSDPTFDPPGSYPGAVTLTKTAGRALNPEQIGHVDAVLLSHDQHFDNLDRSGRELIQKTGTVLTTQVAADRLGGSARGLVPWERYELLRPNDNGLTITATPARHGPAWIEPIAGDVTGFMISSRDGAPLVYITGDTVWFDGTAEVARRFQPKVVLAFAGAAQTRGPFHLTMNASDVLETALHFPTAAVVPVHHQGWQHFSQSQDDLIKSFVALSVGDRLHPISPGESITLPV